MDNERINSIIRPAIEGLGFDFWGAEYILGGGRAVLRIYIEALGEDKAITVGDCQKVSKQLSVVLTVEDPITGQYILEVSSPGINRRLFNKEQLARYVGREVKIKTRSPIDGQQNFKASLVAVEGDEVCIDQAGQPIKLLYTDIEKAKLNEM